MQRIKVAVLGAGGLVAQRLQQRLIHHPWFSLVAVAGSPRFKGHSLSSVPWVLTEQRPDLPDVVVDDVADEAAIRRLVSEGVSVAFSSLPSTEAQQLEPLWVNAGVAVFSNASAYRGADGVPLVIPEINPAALRTSRPLRHACATNCTLIPLVLPLAAIHEAFGLKGYTMRSEQGLSGGGHAYMERAMSEGAVDPTIPGEAEKTASEFETVLGWEGKAVLNCGRVMRPDGHHVFVEADVERPVDEKAVMNALKRWSNEHRTTLPSAPHQPLMLTPAIDVEAHLFANGHGYPERPDPATELDAGMAVAVGSITCPTDRSIRFEAFSHNTIRGAAGGVIYLAELAHEMELLSSSPAHP
ncbi:MAG: hypothetical protein VXX90_03385 [Candidatus Thermoplasmatota archaeon]|nr:hypothetical protein [Candidatus Thermoplasmatota archaeon]